MGYKVIVAEAERFPRDKVCGDGVSPIALSELTAMGITQTEQFAAANEIKQVGLFIKNDQVIVPLSKPDHLLHHARIIPRLELDGWIYEAAKDAGARYIESARVTGYETKADAVIVELKQGQQVTRLKAKLIVGADGSSSVISRQLNGSRPDDAYQLLGLRSYYEGVEGPRDRVDIYFTEESFPGIFWLFPKGPAGANIGMAMVSDTLPKKPAAAREMLKRHIAGNRDIRARIGSGKMQGKIQGWPITFYDSKRRIIGDRILLAGDAAGLINPLSGDGIQYALLSARWASETIAACLVKNDLSEGALFAYKRKIEQELGYDFALSNLLVQFPRNKSLSQVWMTILEVMIARAKGDKAYADIIAGIFEGTYPSFKALNAPFILKSLKQGASELGHALTRSISSPEEYLNKCLKLSGDVSTMLEELSAQPGAHMAWLKDTAVKTLSVAGHVLQHIKRR
jgi:geranylgeranyl reductase family protein